MKAYFTNTIHMDI